MNKNIKNLFLLLIIFVLSLTSCGDNTTSYSQNSNDITPVDPKDDAKANSTHYLKFIENGSEVLSLVVLENETYEDLLPYFPTLNNQNGYLTYWDGDYSHTSYTKEDPFKVYDSNNLIIEIYSYSEKIDN